MKSKLEKVKKVISSKNLDAAIITNPFNILYLTGFKGISPQEREAILVVGKSSATLITAALYQNEAKRVASKYLKIKIAKERNEIEKFIKEALKGARRVGFEERNLTVSELKRFSRTLRPLKLIPTRNLIEGLRVTKTEEEIKKIEKAQVISQKAFGQILKHIKPGQTEEEIAHTLSAVIKSLGGQGLAFESIIASGQNASLPHHITGSRKIKKSEVLLFDFGAKYQNYCADLSRTIFMGRAKDEHKNIYSYVQNAQAKAIEKIKDEVKSQEAFDAANDIFKEINLDEYFIHGLGHGIGLEVHESPHLRSKIKDKLKENMVFSVEPGLYLGWGGVRIEDLVTIKNGRAKVLGKLSKDLIEIQVN